MHDVMEESTGACVNFVQAKIEGQHFLLLSPSRLINATSGACVYIHKHTGMYMYYVLNTNLFNPKEFKMV